MVENKDNEKLLSLEHKTLKDARVLNLEFDSVQDKSKWKESLKLHIDYLDALYAEQVTQQAKALEKPKCINALTIWMKANAPHVIVPKAQEYATKLYENNVINIESVASKIVEKKTFLLELGVERDDNDEIIAGLVNPKNGNPLLSGPNLLGKYVIATAPPSGGSSPAKAPAPAPAPAPVPVPQGPPSSAYSTNR